MEENKTTCESGAPQEDKAEAKSAKKPSKKEEIKALTEEIEKLLSKLGENTIKINFE